MPIISVRISEEEKLQLQEKARESGLTESSYVRKKLFETQTEEFVAKHDAMLILTKIFTEMNYINEFEDLTKIKSIEKGARELWQILL